MYQSIFLWILIGLIAGIIVNVIFPTFKKLYLGTIGAAIVGAFVGGVLYSGLKIGKITSEIDPTALLMALVGASLLVFFVSILVKTETSDKTN